MHIFNLSSVVEKALAAALRPVRRDPEPWFTVQAASGASVAASTATGAFRALGLLSSRDRENAKIYDEDGLCLYR